MQKVFCIVCLLRVICLWFFFQIKMTEQAESPLNNVLLNMMVETPRLRLWLGLNPAWIMHHLRGIITAVRFIQKQLSQSIAGVKMQMDSKTQNYQPLRL